MAPGLEAWRAEDTRGHVARYLEQYRRRLSVVRVDAIGVGHNFGLHLRDLGFPVELVNVSRACEDQPQLGENNLALRFVNLKAQYYQTLADAFELNRVHGFTDDVTLGQLANLLYEIDSHGRIRIESKEKARLRGITSPDRAEALMLAIGNVPATHSRLHVTRPGGHQASRGTERRPDSRVPRGNARRGQELDPRSERPTYQAWRSFPQLLRR
jgi:hypothetical protein